MLVTISDTSFKGDNSQPSKTGRKLKSEIRKALIYSIQNNSDRV